MASGPGWAGAPVRRNRVLIKIVISVKCCKNLKCYIHPKWLWSIGIQLNYKAT